jgi:hypothetical protein
MTWAGHVTCLSIKEGRKILTKSEGNRRLGRPNHRWETITMVFNEVGYQHVK